VEPENYFYKPLTKEQEIKNFKKIYGGGFLGYTHIHSLGNVSHFINLYDIEFKTYLEVLELKINEYLNEIPDNIIYSVLPVLR
jgi:hypothetical protein